MSEIDYDQAKFIEGYKNYIIFANGQILNCDTDKWLKGYKRKDDYIIVGLRKNNKRKLFYLHQLLARAFIPNPENKQFIDHINHQKNDNRIENLRWSTSSENCKNKPLKSTNTSGFRGVYIRDSRWIAFWNDTSTGKQHIKSFAISKYGFIQALKLAVNYRYQMEQAHDYLKLETPDEFFRSNHFLNMFYEYN